VADIETKEEKTEKEETLWELPWWNFKWENYEITFFRNEMNFNYPLTHTTYYE
jgi:hypothetical protein